MKKTYIKPSALAVTLFAESSILSGSFTEAITIDSDDTTTSVFSDQRGGWNSADWSGEE